MTWKEGWGDDNAFYLVGWWFWGVVLKDHFLHCLISDEIFGIKSPSIFATYFLKSGHVFLSRRSHVEVTQGVPSSSEPSPIAEVARVERNW